MARVVVDAQQQRVALGRVGVARQGVLQRGNHLVAVQRDHPVIVVSCIHITLMSSNHLPFRTFLYLQAILAGNVVPRNMLGRV